MKVRATRRMYVLTFHASGHSYSMTSDEVQRLLDEYPAITATKNKVVLPGHNTSHPGERSTIRPASLGGGPAFEVEK